MLVFARTFKFKATHNLFFRRLHRVVKVVRNDKLGVWQVWKVNGVYLEVPMEGTIVLMGRDLKIS
jgi:hypothetical protein